MTTATTMNLWDTKHPYYCETSRWCEHQGNPRFASWADFTDSAFYDGDRDQNLLIRWDWNIRDDYDGTNNGEPVHELLLFFVLQRKPIFAVVKVVVVEADELAVRKWLKGCAVTLADTWAPFLAATN